MVSSVIIPSAWGRMQCLLVYVCTYGAIWGAPTDGIGWKREYRLCQIFPSQTFYFHFNPLLHRQGSGVKASCVMLSHCKHYSTFFLTLFYTESIGYRRKYNLCQVFSLVTFYFYFNPLSHRRLGTKGNTTCVMFSHRKHSTFISSFTQTGYRCKTSCAKLSHCKHFSTFILTLFFDRR
jgi:hypothetical protein